MKLYLSSYRIPDLKAFTDFIGKPANDTKLGLILNAQDYKPAAQRLAKAQECSAYFSDLGFKVEEIDLRDYFNNNSGLLEKFNKFDVLWFNGGNVFRLIWAVKKANADKLLNQALANGLVYAGDSAGAILIGPTFKYFDKADDPSKAEEIIYKGLELIDFCILPHWDSPEFYEIVRDIKPRLENDGYKTIPLTDEEFLLVENGKITNKIRK